MNYFQFHHSMPYLHAKSIIQLSIFYSEVIKFTCDSYSCSTFNGGSDERALKRLCNGEDKFDVELVNVLHIEEGE
jgi:hypothetical protein